MNKVRSIIAAGLKPVRGNKFFIPLFERLYSFAFFGLFSDEYLFNTSGELNVLGRIKKCFSGGEIVIFDVGANEGDYSKNVMNIFESSRLTIHAFEPVTHTYSICCKTLKNFDNVVINNFGLGEKEEEAIIYTFNETTGISSLHGNNIFRPVSSQKIYLKTLDKYCEDNGIRKIHFLKIDVEGHDYFVLRGSQTMLEADKISIIQFEFGSLNINSRTYFRDFYDLLGNKFSFYRIVKNGLIPIKKYTYRCEVFAKVTNYLAVHKSIAL
jgi:FkbM family methyltransferase